MALHSPEVFAQIVDSYIDGYRKRGWMPECRANNLPGWTQGGWLIVPLSPLDACSFEAALYARAAMLSWDILPSTTTTKQRRSGSTSQSSMPRKSQTPKSTHQSGTSRAGSPMYTSQVFLCFPLCTRAERSPCFCSYYGYVPYGALDTSSIGLTTREGSRTLEVRAM